MGATLARRSVRPSVSRYALAGPLVGLSVCSLASQLENLIAAVVLALRSTTATPAAAVRKEMSNNTDGNTAQAGPRTPPPPLAAGGPTRWLPPAELSKQLSRLLPMLLSHTQNAVPFFALGPCVCLSVFVFGPLAASPALRAHCVRVCVRLALARAPSCQFKCYCNLSARLSFSTLDDDDRPTVDGGGSGGSNARRTAQSFPPPSRKTHSQPAGQAQPVSQH